MIRLTESAAVSTRPEMKPPISGGGEPVIVIFDVDGVLNNYSPLDYVAMLARRAGIDERVARAKILPHSENLCVGRIDLSEFQGIISTGLRIRPEDVHWDEYYRYNVKLNQEVIEIAREIKSQGATVALMTNENSTRAAIVRSRLPRPEPAPLHPAQTGYAKPDQRSYIKVVASLQGRLEKNATYGNAAFVDDTEKNVTSASAIGIHGILYLDPISLDGDLGRFLRGD